MHKTILDGTKMHGHSGSPLVMIRGDFAGGNNGLELRAPGCHVKSLIVSRFRGAGIWIENVAGARIGGTEAHKRNVLSGNSGYGAVMNGSGAASNVVDGNFIGTDYTGTKSCSNGHGVLLINGASNNVIGGHDPGSHNVISGNTLGNGVSIGSFSFPYQTASTAIGGAAHQQGNLISGNYAQGIQVCSSTGVVIQGNTIGLSAGGSPLGSQASNGVDLDCGTNTNVLIGGTEHGAGNTIAYSSRDGT